MDIKNYLGSKAASGAYQAIIASMPAHDVYIESHLGSGAVMMRKQLCGTQIGIEINPDVAVQASLTMCDRCEVVTCDSHEFLRNFNYEGRRVLIYSDPPYLWSTRTSNKKYEFEYSESDHRDLLQVLLECVSQGAMVILSGYPNCLYDQALPGWYSREFRVMTRGGPRTEKLWLSFDPDYAVPHWHDYAGSTFTERQRIQRKAERWGEKYASMPAAEKSAVLAAMLQHGHS